MFQQSLATVQRFPDCRDNHACRSFYREFSRRVADMYQPQFVFDMAGVQHLNAAGIDLLLKCVVKIADCDGEVRIAGAAPEIALILELTQLDEIVEVCDSVEAAMQSFTSFRIPRAGQPRPAVRAA